MTFEKINVHDEDKRGKVLGNEWVREYVANNDVCTSLLGFGSHSVTWKYIEVATIVCYCVTKIRDV